MDTTHACEAGGLGSILRGENTFCLFFTPFTTIYAIFNAFSESSSEINKYQRKNEELRFKSWLNLCIIHVYGRQTILTHRKIGVYR